MAGRHASSFGRKVVLSASTLSLDNEVREVTFVVSIDPNDTLRAPSVLTLRVCDVASFRRTLLGGLETGLGCAVLELGCSSVVVLSCKPQPLVGRGDAERERSCDAERERSLAASRGGEVPFFSTLVSLVFSLDDQL